MTTSEQRDRTLWLCVTPDQYELPMIVADSAKELARKAGVTAETLVLEKAVRNQRGREMLEALPDFSMKHLALHAKRKRIRKKHADRLLRRE